MRRSSREVPSDSPSRAESNSTSLAHQMMKATATLNSGSPLFLKQSHVKFNAPSKKESVFFDECNREIISVTSGFDQTNKTRVIFQKTEDVESVEFLLPVEKRILSIKLNSTRTVLAYHVERNIIEFINIHRELGPDNKSTYVLDNKRYVQSSRAKNSKLIGFLWTGVDELVIITDLSVEFYHLDASRHRLTHVKMFQSATNWFVYQPPVICAKQSNESPLCDSYSVLMVSTGSLGILMQPFLFTGRKITRLLRFEVEGSWQGNEKMELFERSITISHIYGCVRLLVLQHESLNLKSRGAQIVIYTIDLESGSTSKTHTLDLDTSGRFAINIIDNLVIAHDQPSKSSFIFDIMVQSTEKSDCPNHFVSLIDSQTLKKLQLDTDKPIEMYSLNWVFFQPNFIVDAKLGLLTTLELDLRVLQRMYKRDDSLILQFLAYRKDSSDVILKKCKEIVSSSFERATNCDKADQSPLIEVSSTFEHLSKLVISAPQTKEDQKQTYIQMDLMGDSETCIEASIHQEEVRRLLFKDFESCDFEIPVNYQFVSSVLLEFIYALKQQQKKVDFLIYELLLACMLRAKRYFQIVQMIRCDIFSDSQPMAWLLLSAKDQYAPAVQLGMDMLHRLTRRDLPADLPPEYRVQEQ